MKPWSERNYLEKLYFLLISDAIDMGKTVLYNLKNKSYMDASQ